MSFGGINKKAALRLTAQGRSQKLKQWLPMRYPVTSLQGACLQILASSMWLPQDN
jgi:hypothetical protein